MYQVNLNHRPTSSDTKAQEKTASLLVILRDGSTCGSPAASGDPLLSEENPGQALLRKGPHVSDRENVLPALKAS